jgi:hypothetical protein
VLVERIGGGDLEMLIRLGKREDLRLPEEFWARPLADGRVRIIAGTSERQIELMGHRRGDVALRHQAELRQNLLEPFGALLA